MTPENLRFILEHASEEVPGPTGETPLDALVRKMKFQTGCREEVIDILPDTIPLISSATGWRGLDILICQTSLRNLKLGELIGDRLASGAVGLGADDILAARCVHSLGAYLSEGALQRINSEDIRKRHAIEWLALISEIYEVHALEESFKSFPKTTPIGADQAAAMIRLYKRVAARHKTDFNGPISAFLDALPPEIASEAAIRLKDVIGSTYAARARERMTTVTSRPSRTSPSSGNAYKSLWKGIENVIDKTRWAKEQAEDDRVAA